jgi:N-acetylglucosaminyldiphosphoundecaprenol N-acetyl-beta-D-mannosaminyltransferase
MTRVDVLGVGFDPVDLDGAVTGTVALLAEKSPHLVITANVEMVMLSRRLPALRAALARASLVVADGVGVVWGSRQLGRPLPARVPGIDLADRLCRAAARRGWTVYLFGGRPGVAAEAGTRLRALYPGMTIVGTAGGYFSPDEEPGVVRAIRDARPMLLLAALGSPWQELWLDRHLADLGAGVAVGVGGTFDVWTGRARRAPRLMQTLGLEWCYRLVRQPTRFLRQLAIPHFMALVYLRRLETISRRLRVSARQ